MVDLIAGVLAAIALMVLFLGMTRTGPLEAKRYQRLPGPPWMSGRRK
jgi:formate hydrogenlyase subunit 4